MLPLIRGYLRSGAFVSNGAVIDHQFDTTDICIIVNKAMITGRYTRQYDFFGHDARSVDSSVTADVRCASCL